MLSKHCEKCGYPLLEKNGRIYCVVCESISKKSTNKDIKLKKYDNIELSNNMNRIINNKIIYLIDKLEKEDEVSRIKEIGEAIYILLKIKDKL